MELTWLQENETVVNILALLGAIYAAARIVVVLTPTPNDNEAIEKYVGPVLKFIGKLVGLDLTQGYTPAEPKK